MLGWLFKKNTAKVAPPLTKQLMKWENLLGTKARKNLEAELRREADRAAATRKAKREEKGGRRRRTRRHRR